MTKCKGPHTINAANVGSTRDKKGETAVHCCNPALSVLVMSVSRNVFHVVSALQSTVFISRQWTKKSVSHMWR